MFQRTFSLSLLLGIALLASSKLNAAPAARGEAASPGVPVAGRRAHSPGQLGQYAPTLLLPSPSGFQTIHNDFFWVDQNGNRIATRSGTLCQFGKEFWWYGGGSRAMDQTCYVSTDLVHWTYKGVALRTEVDANRMDVLYNDTTKKYVMFLKYNGNGAFLGIATADKPEGPFTFKSQTLVDNARMGDMSAFKDTDGKAYIAYVSWAVGTNRQHGIYLMSRDYLTLDKRMYLWDIPSREAPLIMKRNNIYYYMTSRTAGIRSTPTNYYTATNLAGPWTRPKVLLTPGSDNSWDTQCDFAFPIHGTQGTTYMYCGDRWIHTEARQGDYPWLPFEFDGDTPIVNYYQDWDINLTTGTWCKFDPARNLALNKTASASSATAPNVAANVTASTTYRNYINTRWESAASDPQWIMVDLGTSQEINRVILKWHWNAAKDFKIQTSTDAAAWTERLQHHPGRRLHRHRRSLQDHLCPVCADVRHTAGPAKRHRPWRRKARRANRHTTRARRVFVVFFHGPERLILNPSFRPGATLLKREGFISKVLPGQA